MGTRRMAGRVGSRQGRAHLWWEGGERVIGTRSLAPPAPWATRGRPPGPLETLCGKARAATSAGRGGCACRDAGRAHASATWCGACQPQLQSQRTFKGDEGRCTVVRASWACAHLGEVPGSRSRRTMRLVDIAERFHSHGTAYRRAGQPKERRDSRRRVVAVLLHSRRQSWPGLMVYPKLDIVHCGRGQNP